MTELEGIAKTIFDEIMDEIDEEITEGLESLINEVKLKEIIKIIQEKVTPDTIKTIENNYSEDMNSAKKLILGEKASRVVTAEAKVILQELVSDILKQAFDVIDELRNEIIGEVFEETA